MKIVKQYEFPQHVDDIYSSYTTEQFVKEKIKAMGGRNIDVRITRKGDEVTLQIIREMAAEVPGPLRKFAKPWNTVKQTEVWKGSAGGPYHARMTIEIEDVPVSISGEMKLMAAEKELEGGRFELEQHLFPIQIPYFPSLHHSIPVG